MLGSSRMKRLSAYILAVAILLSCAVISPYAVETGEQEYLVSGEKSQIVSVGAELDDTSVGELVSSVPVIRITTENGNGTQLLKSDGYVNAQISITDTEGATLSNSVLLKVRGNSTAIDSIPKKAFTFKFDKKTEVLGMGKGKKWALLANCFDPTLLRNYLVFDFAQKMELPYTSEQRFLELWLDGAYRGCYTLYEPVQEGKDRVDIDIESNDGKKDFLLEYEASRKEDDVTYINVGGLRFALSDPEEPDSEQLSYITDVMTDIINTLKAGDETAIRQKIDVDSFAKFYLLNEYAKTADFGLSSVFFFYKDGKLYAGPPWDYDLALGNLNGELNSASAKAASVSDGILQEQKNFYRWLCNKDWFKKEIKRFYYQYYPYIESISADGGLLDTLRDRYADTFAENFKTWRVNRWWLNYQKVPFSTYDENFNFLKSWCAERNAWLTEYYGIIPDATLLGDADHDREITVYDATVILRHLVNIPMTLSVDEKAADVDGNGIVEVMDATFLQRYLCDMEVRYPVGEPLID